MIRPQILLVLFPKETILEILAKDPNRIGRTIYSDSNLSTSTKINFEDENQRSLFWQGQNLTCLNSAFIRTLCILIYHKLVLLKRQHLLKKLVRTV